MTELIADYLKGIIDDPRVLADVSKSLLTGVVNSREAVGLLSELNIRAGEDITALGAGNVPIVLEGIGKELDGKFYASSGQLKFGREDWQKLIAQL